MNQGEKKQKKRTYKIELSKDEYSYFNTILPPGYSVHPVKGRKVTIQTQEMIKQKMGGAELTNGQGEKGLKQLSNTDTLPGAKQLKNLPQFYQDAKQIIDFINKHQNSNQLKISGDDRSIKIPSSSQVRQKETSFNQIEKNLNDNKYLSKQQFSQQINKIFLYNYVITKTNSQKYLKTLDLEISYLRFIEQRTKQHLIQSIQKEKYKQQINKAKNSPVKAKKHHNQQQHEHSEIQKQLTHILKRIHQIPLGSRKSTSKKFKSRRKKALQYGTIQRKNLLDRIKQLDHTKISRVIEIVFSKQQMKKKQLFNIDFQILDIKIIKKIKKFLNEEQIEGMETSQKINQRKTQKINEISQKYNHLQKQSSSNQKQYSLM